MFGVYYSLYGGAQRELKLLGFGIVAVLGCLLAVGLGVAFGSLTHLPFLQAHTSAQATTAATTQASAPAAPPAHENTSEAATLATGAVQAAFAANGARSWSASAYDLDNNTWLVRTNADQKMVSASLYKLYAVYGLAQKIPFDQWGTKQVAGHSLKTCVDLMLRVSDNTCGHAVGALVGWGTIDKSIHSYGFMATTLNRKDGPLTTANDTTKFMTDLYSGKLLDKPVTDFIMGSLAAQKYRSAIPAGCGVGCTVYNKTGLETTVAHDTAIVKSPAGNYAVTIMSTGGSYGKIANVEHALQTALVNAHTQPAKQ